MPSVASASPAFASPARRAANAARTASAGSRPARAPAPPTTTTDASRASGRSCDGARATARAAVMAFQTPVSDREQKILGIIATARGKRPKFRDEHINMAHGAGGKATQSLIEGMFAPALASDALLEMGDAGSVEVDGVGLALTTDSYVVRPLRFPGGSIGELAVNGTVNDLAVSGARPLGLSVSFVLEEGLAADDLSLEVEAVA